MNYSRIAQALMATIELHDGCIMEFLADSEELRLALVYHDARLFKHIKVQTEELVLLALERSWDNDQFVAISTPAIERALWKICSTRAKCAKPRALGVDIVPALLHYLHLLDFSRDHCLDLPDIYWRYLRELDSRVGEILCTD